MIIRICKLLIRILLYPIFRAKPVDAVEIRKKWKYAGTCCVLAGSGIGDGIMATPFIKAIKERKPQGKLIILCSESNRPVFEENPHVDLILDYNGNRNTFSSVVALCLKMRREKPDFFFAAQPANTIRHALIAAFSGAKILCKHTYDYTGACERDYSFAYHVLLPDKMERHRVKLNLDFLRHLGDEIPENSIYPEFHTNKGARKKMEAFLQTFGISGDRDGMAAVHAGSGRQEKRWPAECFSEIIGYLVRKNLTIFLVGGKSERNLNHHIKKAAGGNRVINIAGVLTLDETAALMEQCRFLISNDSGIMHLATSLDIAVIALFGPTDSRHIGPMSKNAIVMNKSPRIKDITPQDVMKAANSIIESM